MTRKQDFLSLSDEVLYYCVNHQDFHCYATLVMLIISNFQTESSLDSEVNYRSLTAASL